jgi:hypothetical protein
MNEDFNTYNLTTTDANGTTIISRAGDTKVPGKLGYITVLKDTAHTIAFYDGETSGGTLLFTKPASMAAGTYWFNRPVTKGLCAVVAASFAGDIVVGFK